MFYLTSCTWLQCRTLLLYVIAVCYCKYAKEQSNKSILIQFEINVWKIYTIYLWMALAICYNSCRCGSLILHLISTVGSYFLIRARLLNFPAIAWTFADTDNVDHIDSYIAQHQHNTVLNFQILRSYKRTSWIEKIIRYRVTCKRFSISHELTFKRSFIVSWRYVAKMLSSVRLTVYIMTQCLYFVCNLWNTETTISRTIRYTLFRPAAPAVAEAHVTFQHWRRCFVNVV